MRLFVFDVDGTLISHGNTKLKPQLIDKLNEILSNGDVIAIASGRPYSGIMKILSQINNGKKFCLCANGTQVTDIEGNSLYFCGLTLKDYLTFCKVHENILKHRSSNIYCYTSDKIAYLKNNFWIKFEKEANNFAGINLKKEKLAEDYPILKFMIASGPRRSKSFDEKQISEDEKIKYHIVRTSPYFLEFINKNSDKAEGVRFLKEYLKIQDENVYTFGDSGNDLLMIKNFNGIAMGNAIKECKEVAKFITKDVDEDGVIYAIDNFVK